MLPSPSSCLKMMPSFKRDPLRWRLQQNRRPRGLRMKELGTLYSLQPLFLTMCFFVAVTMGAVGRSVRGTEAHTDSRTTPYARVALILHYRSSRPRAATSPRGTTFTSASGTNRAGCSTSRASTTQGSTGQRDQTRRPTNGSRDRFSATCSKLNP